MRIPAFWDGYLSDEIMGIFAPIVVYWLYSGFYYFLSSLDLKQITSYRLHSKREEEEKNKVTLSQVIWGVLVQQAFQVVSAYLLLVSLGEDDEELKKRSVSIYTLILQLVIAFLVMDGWQYLVHRGMHVNKFLYRHIHSWHHRLIVPYAFGALYNHPLEGLLLDTLGGALSFLISGMSPRLAVYFFCFATMKTVDDHCGMRIPVNPFQFLFPNNAAYHDVHHQLSGMKYNFSQPFFVTWDWLLGTYMPYEVRRNTNGRLEAHPVKDGHTNGVKSGLNGKTEAASRAKSASNKAD